MKKGLMTSGNIWKQIILFSIPLLFGNFFQLMYNTIDSIIVGQYVGKEALAAVGASTPLINLLISFFMGLSTGAGVIVAKFFGGKKYEELSDSVHTFILFSLIFGIILSVVGVIFSETLMVWMKTPEDVIVGAVEYLKIYFYGCVFVCVYNAGTGILQSVGDSKSPLIFLIISSIINVVLDLYFVRDLNMGVAGAAWATLIAQAVSALLVILKLSKTSEPYKLFINKLRINSHLLYEIVRIGVPTGLQLMIVSFSNVLVQTYINDFGSSSIAGFSSALKYDSFIGLPLNSFALAITTFSGQNLGAKQFKRVREGIKITLILSTITVTVLGVIAFVFAELAIGVFSNDFDVIKTGALTMRIMGPFYFVLCFHQIYSGALRASGRSMAPMVISILCFVLIRQIFLASLINVINDISLIAWSYSLTWSISSLITSAYHHFTKWLEKDEAMSLV